MGLIDFIMMLNAIQIEVPVDITMGSEDVFMGDTEILMGYE